MMYVFSHSMPFPCIFMHFFRSCYWRYAYGWITLLLHVGVNYSGGYIKGGQPSCDGTAGEIV